MLQPISILHPSLHWCAGHFWLEFFRISQPNILFSYKAQIDDVAEDDSVSLPHHLSCSSMKSDTDYICQDKYLLDSTHFNVASVNPLYIHSLQSPESFVWCDNNTSEESINSS